MSSKFFLCSRCQSAASCWKLMAGVYEQMKVSCRKHQERVEAVLIRHLENEKCLNGCSDSVKLTAQCSLDPFSLSHTLRKG